MQYFMAISPGAIRAACLVVLPNTPSGWLHSSLFQGKAVCLGGSCFSKRKRDSLIQILVMDAGGVNHFRQSRPSKATGVMSGSKGYAFVTRFVKRFGPSKSFEQLEFESRERFVKEPTVFYLPGGGDPVTPACAQMKTLYTSSAEPVLPCVLLPERNSRPNLSPKGALVPFENGC